MPHPTRIGVWASVATAALLLFYGCADPGRTPRTSPSSIALESLTIMPERTPLERRLDGTIEAVNQSTVAAQTAGRVDAVLYDVDDFVPAGAVIVRLRAVERRAGLRQAEAAEREASAHASEAQRRHRRIAGLYQEKVVAKATFDEATAARDAALARLQAARAALGAAREGSAYTEIRAPYAGIVTRRHVEPGETVGPGTPLMTGLSLQHLRVAVDVPQSIVEQIRSLAKAAVYVNGRRIEAGNLRIFPEASTPSSTFRARLELPEHSAGLYPGTFVKVAFVIGEIDRLLVPAHAVLERGELSAVYVIGTDARTSLRQIRPGHRFGDRIEVLAGLSAGEQVVLEPLAVMRRHGSARSDSTSDPPDTSR